MCYERTPWRRISLTCSVFQFSLLVFIKVISTWFEQHFSIGAFDLSYDLVRFTIGVWYRSLFFLILLPWFNPLFSKLTFRIFNYFLNHIKLYNTFTKINFVAGVLQRVCRDFKQHTIVFKCPEHFFSGTYLMTASVDIEWNYH